MSVDQDKSRDELLQELAEVRSGFSRAHRQLRVYERLISASPDFISLVDSDCVYRIVNDSYLKATGKTRREIVGRNVAGVVGKKAFRTLVRPALKRCFAGETVTAEGWHSFPKLGRRYLHATYAPYRDEEGNVAGAMIRAHDITERKKAETELAESEEKFRQMFSLHSAMMYLVAPESGTFVEANEAACRFYGRPAAEMKRLRLTDLTGISEEAQQERLAAILDGRMDYLVSRHRLKSGEWRDVEVYAVPITMGERTYIYTVVHDITERRRYEEQLQKLSLAVEHSPASIVITDRDGVIEYVNPTFAQLTGYSADEAVGRKPSILKSGRQPWEFYAGLWEEILAGRGWSGELVNRTKGGREYVVTASISPLRGEEGEITHFVGVTQDITHIKTVERELQAIFDNSQVGILLLKGGRYCAKANARLAEIFGYASPEEMAGLSMRALHLTGERFAEFGRKFYDELVHGEQIHVDYELARKDGTPVWCTLSGKAIDPLRPPDLDKGVIWVIDDISARKRAEEKLRELARTDGLTGLCNRRCFMELAGREFIRAVRYGHDLSLLMLDVDRFKNVNDTYGHAVGDTVLQELSRIGREELREADVFARLGGEEFVALLPETGREAAAKVAERLRRKYAEAIVPTAKGPLSFTVSFGVAGLEGDSQNIESILRQADKALYRAKEGGRNRVEVE